MLARAIDLLTKKQDLEPEICIQAAREIMEGRATDDQIATFLTSMKSKIETSSEVASFAKVMREFCVRIDPKVSGTMVDTCGTGGDGLNTFNISTASAFVIAGAGLPVAKHGNRSVSSNCGSADILEALGVMVELAPHHVKDVIENVGIGFMYAPFFHPAMKHVQPVRRKLGISTIFNILGPLTNPANVGAQVIGVHSPELIPKVAGALNEMGVKRAMVVHGSGMDEISSMGETLIAELCDGQIREYSIVPEDFGLARTSMDELISTDMETSLRYFNEVLDGKPGPRLDIVLMNAASAIMMGGLASDLREGMEQARESIFSGMAKEKLEALKQEAGKYEA